MLLSYQVTCSFPTSLNSIAIPTRIWSETKSQEQEASFNITRIFFVLINLFFWLYINSIWLLLLRSGDIETNPGPIKSMKDIFLDCQTYSDNLKFLHLNVRLRSITKQLQFKKNLMNDVGANCIYGLSNMDRHKDWHWFGKPEQRKLSCFSQWSSELKRGRCIFNCS